MKLYFKYMKLHIKSILQYKVSFILSFISQFFVFFSFYFIIMSLFDKFNNIKGFTVYQVLLTFSVTHIGFSLNEVFARGIDNFDKFIKAGRYDQLLVKPRSILLQILGSDMACDRLSRILQSLVILIVALTNLNVNWDALKILTLINMVTGSFTIFLGILILNAAYCFYTIEGLEFRNVLTYGGREMAQYPVSVFKKEFVMFFTYIVPFAFVNYYPLLYFLGKSNNYLLAFSPLLILLFLIPCLLFFNFSSKRYLSCGS